MKPRRSKSHRSKSSFGGDTQELRDILDCSDQYVREFFNDIRDDAIASRKPGEARSKAAPSDGVPRKPRN